MEVKALKITINASRSYDVFVGSDLLLKNPCCLSEIISGGRAVIITDQNVQALHGEHLTKMLESENITSLSYILPFGEENKTLHNAEKILDFFEQNSLTSTDVVIGFGGGVITDIAGFCASIYKRGIKLINIPTTLIGMVDAAIGGKNGVNTATAKNQIGTFYQPSLVICDTSFLNTLDEIELKNGLAEVIKYAMLDNKSLLDMLESGNKLCYTDVVYQSILSKKHYVELDETDKGARRMLNLGHTFAHAIEMHSHHKTPHGLAVSMGMAMLTKLTERDNLSETGTYKRLSELSLQYGLPISYDCKINELVQYIKSDKKIDYNGLNLVVLKAPLCPYIHTVDISLDPLFCD